MTYVGVDLGGSKILAAVVSARASVESRAKRSTPFDRKARDLSKALVESVSEALSLGGASRASLRAIGLGAPGPLDPERGLILRTPHLAVRRFPARRCLEDAFGVPVAFDNDVHMALRGESLAGAARGYANVVAVWVGTGVGGAVLRDGRLDSGVNRNAGEIGHMLIDARKAKAGSDEGSLEWSASKSGIVRWMRKQRAKGRKTSLSRELSRRRDRLHSSDFGRAVRAGDALAREAAERSARYVAIGIANLFDAIAPELFVLGGGVVEALGRPYVDRVRRLANDFAFTTELARIQVKRSSLGDDAGVIGAALAARELVRKKH